MSEYIKTQKGITDKNMKSVVKWNGEDVCEMELHIFRYKEYLNFIRNYLYGEMKVLDIGCRDGGFLVLLRDEVGIDDLHGIELNETASILARDKGIQVYNIDAHNMLEIPSDRYNLVCMTHLLEHTYNPRRILDEAFRALKTNGLMFIEVPLEPKPKEHPTKWGHYYTFQHPNNLHDLVGLCNYSFDLVDEQYDTKKNKWFRVLLRKRDEETESSDDI